MIKNRNTQDPFRERYGEWALIAGAAEGIGAAFSRVLARRRMNLVMADINGRALERTAACVKEESGVEVRTLTIDLAADDAWHLCVDAVTDIDCRLLVYVAAYSRVKPFFDHAPEELDRYIRVNNLTAVRLLYHFAKPLKVRSATGGIVLISSLSGIIAPPLVAAYSGTKGFLLRFAESLHQECSPVGIDLCVCAAGITDTPAYDASRPLENLFTPRAMDPGIVAEYALKHLGKQAVCIPGLKNRLVYHVLTRLVPRRLAVRIVAWQMQRMYPRR